MMHRTTVLLAFLIAQPNLQFKRRIGRSVRYFPYPGRE